MPTPEQTLAGFQAALASYQAYLRATGLQSDPSFVTDMANKYGVPVPTTFADGTPTGVVAPTGTTNWDQYRAFFPAMSDQEWAALVAAMPPDINVQEGFNWIQLAVNTGVSTRGQDLQHEIGLRTAAVNDKQAEINAQNAETDRLYKMGLLEEARASREQEAVLARELNALNKEIADMQHELGEAQLAEEVRRTGATLSASPRDVVEYEIWKRGGQEAETQPAAQTQPPVAAAAPAATAAYNPTTGAGTPVETGAARAVRTGVDKWGRPMTVGRAAQGKIVSPGLLQTGERGWEYVHAPAGTIIAPHAPGETKPTQEGGWRAILNQLRRTPVSQPRYSRPTRMVGGGTVGEGVHTDEQMRQYFESVLAGNVSLYNPNLGGAGVFGANVPTPNQMSRRRYGSMDVSQQDALQSLVSGGFQTEGGTRVGAGVDTYLDWLRQMQRSWIPGLAGAGQSVQYSY